jgi:hypothetical protein
MQQRCSNAIPVSCGGKVICIYSVNLLHMYQVEPVRDSNTLKFWEPNAPDLPKRLESLKYSFSEGYQTSVSCEPMLDEHIGDVIDQVSPFVMDSI